MISTQIDDMGVKNMALKYLRSMQSPSENSCIDVRGSNRNGRLHIRKGLVVNAKCPDLQGNGALLCLITQQQAEIHVEPCEEVVEKNVTIHLPPSQELVRKLSNIASSGNPRNEFQLLQEATQLFFQFRRKESGNLLIQILRTNRFYYPAWLWQSRLMTRREHIVKALSEAQKWGNADSRIQEECLRIAGQFKEINGTFKRCFFCWSIVGKEAQRCNHCQGFLMMTPFRRDEARAGNLLEDTLSRYEAEWQRDPDNRRVAYCLSLGYRSLGNFGAAADYLNAALRLSPREPLFLKSLSLLQAASAASSLYSHRMEESAPQSSILIKSPQSQVENGKSILIVEDSKTSRKVISLVLLRNGYQVEETKTGTEAIESLRKNLPDLILLDVMLPDMTGYQVLDVIRTDQRLSSIPVVMLTGRKGASDRLKGMIGGAVEYLTKPFDPAKLLTVIERYLDPGKPGEKVEDEATQNLDNRQVERPPAPPPQPEPVVVRKSDRRKNNYVLVVEDSATARKVITTVLSRKGYEIEEAETGKQALELIQEIAPQLILLDAVLPDMTGFEILAFVKNNSQLEDVPVIMLTSKDNPVDRQRGVGAGAAAYLTKPFDPSKLLSVIQALLQDNKGSAKES